MQIRLAQKSDIPRIAQLIQESVSGLSSEYYTTEQITNGLTYIFGVDTQLIADGTYFIAEEDLQLVGSGGWSKRKTLFGGDQKKGTDEDPLLDPAMNAARIRAFYVHPAWARKGIGSGILEACESAARQAGFAKIELVATLPGEPLYSARGYERRESMLLQTPAGPLKAFHMTKTLI